MKTNVEENAQRSSHPDVRQSGPVLSTKRTIRRHVNTTPTSLCRVAVIQDQREASPVRQSRKKEELGARIRDAAPH